MLAFAMLFRAARHTALQYGVHSGVGGWIAYVQQWLAPSGPTGPAVSTLRSGTNEHANSGGGQASTGGASS